MADDRAKIKSIREVFSVPEDSAESFLKGVSIGMILGTAMQMAGETLPESPLELRDIFKAILIASRNIQFYGLSKPVTDEEIDAMGALITAHNGRLFINNAALVQPATVTS